MEIIDLSQYDTSYELQCIDFIVEALKPYIRFSINYYGNIEINRIGVMKKEERIKSEDYIIFIQRTFPKLINEEINKINEMFDDERVKKITFTETYKRIFENNYSIHSIHSTISKLNMKQKIKYETFKKMFNEMEKDGTINQQSEYYKENENTTSDYSKKLEEFKEKLNYLYELKKINRKINGTIQDTVQFLENIKVYL
tara:strand:+ start:5633 stop:6229 length:597 start_codon:yes stop_codon:yes gene_type:complete